MNQLEEKKKMLKSLLMTLEAFDNMANLQSLISLVQFNRCLDWCKLAQEEE